MTQRPIPVFYCIYQMRNHGPKILFDIVFSSYFIYMCKKKKKKERKKKGALEDLVHDLSMTQRPIPVFYCIYQMRNHGPKILFYVPRKSHFTFFLHIFFIKKKLSKIKICEWSLYLHCIFPIPEKPKPYIYCQY